MRYFNYSINSDNTKDMMNWCALNFFPNREILLLYNKERNQTYETLPYECTWTELQGQGNKASSSPEGGSYFTKTLFFEKYQYDNDVDKDITPTKEQVGRYVLILSLICKIVLSTWLKSNNYYAERNTVIPKFGTGDWALGMIDS